MDLAGVNIGGTLRTGAKHRFFCKPRWYTAWEGKKVTTVKVVVLDLADAESQWFRIGTLINYHIFLTDYDVVQLYIPAWTICQDDSAYTLEPCFTRTGVELLEFSVLRSLRAKWQPCALQFYLQEVAQSRTQGDPERDPLHPGLASPSEALLSREAGVLRAAVHARPV